jgi:cell shape-determining protein MreD
MTFIWSGVAIFVAALLESGLSLLWPDQARLLDPFLLITIFVCLTRGEGHGMVVGAAAAWAQDIFFGGRVLGLLGLTRVVLAFLVGHAGRRFLLSHAPAQFALIFVATLADAWLLAQFAGAFEVPIVSVSLPTLVMRAAFNSVIGATAFWLIERRRLKQEALV